MTLVHAHQNTRLDPVKCVLNNLLYRIHVGKTEVWHEVFLQCTQVIKNETCYCSSVATALTP